MLFNKGKKAFGNKRYVEAAALFTEAVNLKPKDNLSHFWLARSLGETDKVDEAIKEYGETIELNPNDSVSLNNLGVLYYDKEQDDKAIGCYKRSLELDPKDPIVLSNLGRALFRKGQLLEAARALQHAQQIKPDSAVTEELNQILRQTGNLPKLQKPQDLDYAETLNESLRIEKERSWIGQLDYDDNLGAVAWLGAIAAWILGGIFLYYVPYGQHWDLGTSDKPTTLGYVVWIGEIVVAPLLGAGLTVAGIWVGDKVTNLIKPAFRSLKFPADYQRLQKVNLLPSDELSDSDLKSVASIYARMSKEYLEKIFRSWIEAGQEEKISRLFKFGKWQSDKTRIYGDIGEYKTVSRVAAAKFANTAQEQKAIFDGIDREKEKLTQEGINNAVALMKDILPQITEYSRSRDEFWHWLGLVVGLPKNILEQGKRQVLTVFTDLIEFDRSQEESFNKFGTVNQKANPKIRNAINGLVQKLEKDGLNYPGILKKALAEINKASRNLDEFLFWVNEVMQFDKQLWSSGGILGLLQNLIVYVHAKEEASKKLCRNPEETSRLFQAVDSLREELRRKQVSGDVSILKDVIPRVTEVSRSLAEFFGYIEVLKTFDKNVWYGTQSVLQAFNNHVAYKQAIENAAAKFTQNDSTRQKFLSSIDSLRNQLVQKGFPQASDMLKDILPELTKTCRSKEEFVYWLGELLGLNTSVWRSGAQAVINNFNDLAGFKQAKEMALDKLCASQQEKDDLAKTIDLLKAKLEEKRPSCAGLIKDVILEILKDIDSLADSSYRRSDFIWWLGMCVNFETVTWQAGVKQVLAGYQELKDYVKQRRELTAKFTTNPEEQKRLTIVWDSLDKTANFTRPTSISSLRNSLTKIASFAVTPKEFVFWVGTLSELNNEALEAFCRDIDTVFAYYREQGKSRDFNHLPTVLNQYHETYHQTVLITVNLLDVITDPSLDINKRVEKVSQFLIEQKIVKLGAPPNLVGLKDAVSFDELIRVAGEDTVRSFIQNYSPIRKAMERMGREGIYSYAEAQRPAYYKHFLEEANGLKPGFNKPGEKFRVSCIGNITSWSAEEEAQVMPIADNVQTLKQLVQYLRMEWPNLYENFIEPKRELIKGRPLEEFITSDTVNKMAWQLLGKVQNWQFSEQQRIAFSLKIMEIFVFQETADLRTRINDATDSFNKLRLVVQYWERIPKLILKYKWPQEKSKFYSPVAKFIKQKIATINNKLDDKGKEILQFNLSGGTLSDFFKGWVSEDCTRNTDGEYPHFLDTQAFVMDPGSFLFKVIEENKWIANIYTFVFKDKNGKFYLYLDMFQVKDGHPRLVQNGEGQEELKREFSVRFIQEFMSYLGSQGFDYLLISTDPAQRGIKDALRKVAKEKSGQNEENTFSLKKLGGTEFFSEAGVSEEYVQTISGNHISNSFQDVKGYKVELNKTTTQAIQQRQTELDYIEKLLGEMAAEENRLLSLVKEKQTELNQINQKGREVAISGKSALATALKNASEQKKSEIEKIGYELNELRAKIQEKRLETDRLRADLGMFKSSSEQGLTFASSPVGRTLVLMPIIGALNLFLSQPAQAQEFSPLEELLYGPFAPVLVVTGIAVGLFGLYYILNKLFPEKPEYEPYYGMSTQRPLYEEYKLPQDVDEQLTKVLNNISPTLQDLTPKRINIHLPFEVGIRRSQAVKALKLLFSTLLENTSALDFLKTHSFYQDFKQRARELGLADDFDQPGHEYSFSIGKEEIQQAEDRHAEDFIENALTKLKKEFKSTSPENVLEKIANRRAYIKNRGINRIKQAEFYEYYLLLKAYAYLRFREKLQGVNSLSAEHKYLEAISILEEFLRVGVGAELIALEQDVYLRDALNIILTRELEDVRWQFNRLTASQVKKEQTSQAARDIQYSVVLSSRSTDDILRGVASGDCTAINSSAFYNTIPQFLFDPGFLDFKILQDDKWVGNVYTIVSERNNNPVLIIDAVQLPVWGRSWPVSVRKLSDKVVEKVVEYAQEQGFAQVLMSSFVSNFNAIHENFNAKYPTQAIEIEKVAGFEHLKALGIWDEYAARNEYLETFSPQWNYGLKKVEPNNPKQTLLLRRVWERSSSPQQLEESFVEPTKTSSPLEYAQKDTGGLFKFIQRNLGKVVFGAVLFIMLTLPNIAHAAKFEIMHGQQPNQTQVVAVVEKGDNLWNIAGVAYKGVGQGRYAANAEWSKIYDVNKEDVLKGRQHRVGPQYPDTKQVVNIKPGDRLIIPGSVNYEAAGLKAPSVQAETKPSAQEVKAPEVAPSAQRVQTQQEMQNLQQQKSQVGQQLNQIQQQKQTAQAELEKLQKEKTELTRQILDLKKQFADVQEQLRQAKEKMPSNLQSEEIKQLEQKKTQYTQEIAELESQYKQAQEDLSRITNQKEKMSQELEQLRKQTPQAQTQIKDLQTEIQRLEAQKKQYQEELSKLQNQSDDLQKGIEQLTKDKNQLQGELKDLKQQISDAKNILEESKQKVQPTWKNMWGGLSWPEKTGIILLLISAFGAITAGIILTKRWIKFEHLQEKIEKLQREIEDAEARLGTLRAEEGDITKKKEDAEKAKLEAEAETKKVAAQQVQLETERKRLEQEALNLQQQKQEIEKEKQKLTELEGEKQAVRDEIKALETQRDNLKQGLVQVQQEAQEAIRQAKEQEEKIKAQTKLTQETLTEEQRQLQERLDAKRQEVFEQINALDEELRQARTRNELGITEIGQEKANAQVDLEGLVSERNTVESRLREMGKTIERLNMARDSLLDDLRDLDGQQKALQISVKSLKEEKEMLESRVKELKPAEEIKPEVDELLARARAISKEVDSLYLKEAGKVQTIDSFVNLVRIKSRTGDEDKIREELRAMLQLLGAKVILECGQQCGLSEAGIPVPQNLVVEFPATGKFVNEPGFIINAHMDTIPRSTPEEMDISEAEKEFYHKNEGSFGADDKAGVVVFLEALRFMKENYWDKGYERRRIVFVLTAREEPGPGGFGYGARHLAEKHSQIFQNMLFSLTSDGPLELPNFDPDRSYVVVVPKEMEKANPYRAIIETIAKFARQKGRVLEKTEEGLGSGDFAHFPSFAKADLHIRSPYEGNHSHEKVNVRNLIDHVDLWITILAKYASDIQDIKISSIGSAKGQGMFAPEEHAEVNEVISAAQREGRGSLIWGDAQGWKQAKDGYAQDISLAITGLRRYPRINIQGLGTIDIPEILANSNIILIQPRNHSPPGLVVKDKNSYQVAHSGEAFNSIYIDEKIYKQLYSFEVAILLAHEAIELGAKRIAQRKHILWTVDLAKQVHRLAEEYEIQIVGKSPNGRGSRFDDRIEEMLDFASLNRRVQVELAPEIVRPKQELNQKRETFIPKPEKKQEAPQESKRPVLEYSEEKPEVVDNLRKLFLEGLFREVSVNLPAKLDNFPPPLAQEIRQAYQLGKVKGMPLDTDFMVALALFFSRVFPNHANELVQYMKNLSIYLVDNTRSTYGATLSGNTFYIQRSCIEDLLGRPVRIEEIYQGIKNKDPKICVALFRIVIHEIGSAFFKLSHPANQELEEVFLAMLSKTGIKVSPNTQQEIYTINRTINLDNIARIDWAQKRTRPLSFDYSMLSLDNLFFGGKIVSPVVTSLEQAISSSDKNNTAVNPGGIDLSNIEITLKDEKFVSNLNSADLKILRAARALKEGQDSLAVLYVHEVRLLLKDNILSEKEVTQKALLKNLLNRLEHKELLNLEAVAFSHIIQGEVIFSEERLSSIGRIK